MSAFSLGISIESARQRLDARERTLHSRADRGQSRLHPDAEAKIAELFQGRDRPAMAQVFRSLAEHCRRHGLRCPSRSSLYNAIERVPVPEYQIASLPDEVRAALYNFGDASSGSAVSQVPGDQLVFYCFNYGAARALSFASGMPWLCLVRAGQRRGWRSKSRSLLQAVMKQRGL